MNDLLQFELQSYFKKIGFYIVMMFLIGLGIFVGKYFSISISSNIYKNAPYTITYMFGFLSLFSILFTTLLAAQVLFKEKEANFNLIIFATPLTKTKYLWNRFILVFGLSFFFLTLLIIGFGVGQLLSLNAVSFTHFNILFYIIPLFTIGFINTFFCSAVICSMSWLTQNKLATYISGLFIYILYMVMLLFSGSPLMAKSMPQSQEAIKISALLDPFGLSGFFHQTNSYSILQKNTELLFPTDLFLINRIATLSISLIFLFIAYKIFSFTVSNSKSKKTRQEILLSKTDETIEIKKVYSYFNWKTSLKILMLFQMLNCD